MTTTDDLITRCESYDKHNHRGQYAKIVHEAAARLREQEQEIARLLREGPTSDFGWTDTDGRPINCSLLDAHRASSAAADAEARFADEQKLRAEKAEAERDAAIKERDALRQDVGRYWPFVEMVGMRRPPRGQDEVDAYEMVRERKRAAMKEGHEAAVAREKHCTCDYIDDRNMSRHAEHCDYGEKP